MSAAERPTAALPTRAPVRLSTGGIQALYVCVLPIVLGVLSLVDPDIWQSPWLWLMAGVFLIASLLPIVDRMLPRRTTWARKAVPVLDLFAVVALLAEPDVPRILALLAVVPAAWTGLALRGVGMAVVAAAGFTVAATMVTRLASSSGTTLTANAVGAALVPLTLLAAAWFTINYARTLERQQLATLERERERTALAEQSAADAALLDAIFETARVGLMLLDADGRIVRINPTLSDHPALTGTTVGDVLKGAQILDLESRQPISRRETPFARAALGESFDNDRFWIARPGHDMFAVTVSSRPLMVAGELRGSIASVDDVTAYMRMLEDRDDFVALISHELRTPLTSIAGYMELAMDEEMPAELRSWLRIVQRNSDRLRTLVEDLLMVGEMSRGELHLEPAQADLRRLAEDAVTLLAHRAHRRGVELRLVDGAPVGLVADPRRISQVIENLVSNGIKYTSDDGFVEVRVDSDGTDARLQVADNGPGVEAAEAPRVFERFYRSSAARASGVQGAGLGLWICRMIVQAHGGSIDFASEVGQGSVATVRLPAA